MSIEQKVKALQRKTRETKRLIEEAESPEDLAILEARSEAEDRELYALQKEYAFSQVPRDRGEGHPSLYRVLEAQGWGLGTTASVPVSSRALINDPDTANPLREPGIVLTGFDDRHIYPALPLKDAGLATSVDVLVSTGGSISADVADLTSTAEKSVTDSGGTVETFRMQRAATVSVYHPNGLVALPEFRQLVDDDMSRGYRDAVDAYVISTLESDAGGGGTAGADLFQKIRKARTAIEAQGHSPNLVALSPSDAEALDLTRAGGSTSGDGAFMLPPAPRDIASSPLWGMSVIAAKGVSNPIVLDTSSVQLYIGTASFAADTVTEFSTNQSRFRLESPVLLVVKQPDGVFVIG